MTIAVHCCLANCHKFQTGLKVKYFLGCKHGVIILVECWTLPPKYLLSYMLHKICFGVFYLRYTQYTCIENKLLTVKLEYIYIYIFHTFLFCFLPSIIPPISSQITSFLTKQFVGLHKYYGSRRGSLACLSALATLGAEHMLELEELEIPAW